MNYIAIDPGVTGAIVWSLSQPSGSHMTHAIRMPTTLKDIWDQLALIKSCQPLNQCTVYIEKVGTYMPGNSGPSAATFAEHVGALKMALIGLGYPHELVLPKAWQNVVTGKQVYDKFPADIEPAVKRKILSERKRERKNKIKAKMQQVFPLIKVTLLNADALGILYYAMKQGG